ncbi:hypothetical protein ARMA_2961 [Ardenticatena maritima]|uniref:Endonuclease/exonuclease/phosphatase domain-containing protein n=1 Tax=Ardenticatena maritima TaxID=872965 RepID=A0A0M9UDY4_9CHLR|nr:endonuclease/exonuclease/phosphatase family protein [Ardenticatena maritima]KPL89592.1 hypothetical protein SE16_04020 [Ardenticatena maritima]GAP64538.1 hypothetical protein ARMA_2961 [Ardenticatena maritima]
MRVRKPLLLGIFLLCVGVALLVWNASMPAETVQGCLDCVKTPPPSHMRVLVFNMLHGFPDGKARMARADLLIQTVQALNADVLLLQEVSHTRRDGLLAEYLAERLNMNWVYARANGNLAWIGFEEGEAILSRFPLENVRMVELLPQDDFFEHRIALEATVRTRGGLLRFVSTHLTNGDPAVNQAQADALLAFVASVPTPAVIGGDFNAQPASPTMHRLRAMWRMMPPPPSVPTCCVDVFGAPDVETFTHRIDVAFLFQPPPRWRVLGGMRTLDTPHWTGERWLWASDHAGFFFDLATDKTE